MRLLWVRLVVDDFPAAFAFYRGTLSPTGVADDALWLEHGYAHFWNRSEQARLELELVARDRFAEVLGPVRRPETPTLVFDVDDIDAALSALTQRGATVVVGPHEEGDASRGTRFAQLHDPAGTLMELVRWDMTGWGGRVGW